MLNNTSPVLRTKRNVNAWPFLFSPWCQFLDNNAQQRIASFINKKKCQRTTKILNVLLLIWWTFNHASIEIIENKWWTAEIFKKKQYVQISYLYRQNVNNDKLPPIKLLCKFCQKNTYTLFVYEKEKHMTLLINICCMS